MNKVKSPSHMTSYIKLCPRCNLKLPSKSFYKDKRFLVGLSVWCKKCTRDKQNKYYNELSNGKKKKQALRARIWQKEYDSKPEVIAHKKEYARRPDVIIRRSVRTRAWRSAKVLAGDYGLCKICKNVLGRDNKVKICKICFKGENVPWFVGKWVNKQGYIFLWKPDHPKAIKHKGYVAEHRLIMEQKLGRYLLPNENVHHLNGLRDDNRPENLELWVKSQPCGQRPVDLKNWAKQILELY